MKNSNILPAPRSIAEQFENGTSFNYCIGDGDSIGGEIAGYDEPLYIDWDSEYPSEYRIYVQDPTDVMLAKLKIATETGDFVNVTRPEIDYTVYSVEEAIAVLKKIAK